MRPITCLVAVLVVAPFSGVIAQERAQDSVIVKPGETVRVSRTPLISAPDWAEGRLTAVTADELLLQYTVFGDLSIPRDSVTRLEVRRGGKSYVGKGAGIGFLAGFVSMFVAAHVYEWGGCIVDECYSDTAVGVFAGVVIGAGGALVGAVTGAHIGMHRWEKVPLDRLRVNLEPQRDRRFGLSLSVAF